MELTPQRSALKKIIPHNHIVVILFSTVCSGIFFTELLLFHNIVDSLKFKTMPNTKKNRGHESDTSRKGAMGDEKSKSTKSSPDRGRNENSKSGDMGGNRESSGR